MRSFLILLFITFLSVQPAFAGPLQDRQYETRFKVLYEDDNDLSIFGISGTWLAVMNNGYVEPGIELAYTRFDVDDGFINDTITDYYYGPRVGVNFTPQNPVTGFATLSLIFFGGDIADFYELGYSAGIGLKAFIGNFASVNALLEYERWNGEDTGFFVVDDRNIVRATAGISLFLGNR